MSRIKITKNQTNKVIMNEIITQEQSNKKIVYDVTQTTSYLFNKNLLENQIERLQITFDNIKLNKKKSMQDYFITDILNIIGSGYYICVIKKSKEEVDKTSLFKLTKKNDEIISILCFETLDSIIYLTVSLQNLNIKNTYNLLDCADLLEILPLGAITFYYSKAILFHNIIEK